MQLAPARDLHAVHTADPNAQTWAAPLADTLTTAHQQATAVRAAGPDCLDEQSLAQIRNDSPQHHLHRPADALCLARRYRDYETMILRLVADLAVPFTNCAPASAIRARPVPVKIQQRHLHGC